MDANEIRKWHSVFKRDDELFEVRILGDRTWSGYFYDVEEAIKQLAPFDNANIYYSINEVKKACASRAQFNCFKQVKGTATSKQDIEHRWWLPIDVDCERPSGVSSTNDEKAKAHKKAQDVFRFLRDNGFSTPSVCDSSSGYHILYPIDLDNTQESEDVIKEFLEILSNNFTDEHVKIDVVLHDANRILRLCGTFGRKGRSTEDRPHRMAKILSFPKQVVRMTIAQLKAFNDKYRIKVEQQQRKYNGDRRDEFDLRAFIRKHNIEVAKEVPISGGGTKFVLAHCPFDEGHKAPDSALFELPNGAIAFKCYHNSCSHYDWKAFRLHFEPDAYNKPSQQQYRQYVPQPIPQKPKYQIKEEIPELGEKWLSLSDIQKVDLTQLEKVKTGFVELDKKIGGLYMSEVTVLSGSNACVDCDTEYFNGTEWKKISEYQLGEKVLQYNADGSAELVIPQRYIKSPCDVLYLLQSVTGVDQCVSINHNLVYMTSKGNLAKKSVANFLAQHNASPSGFMGMFYTTFRYEQGNGIELNEWEIRLMCAIICDGHFQNNFKDKNIVRINIKKKRKKQRLERLLDMAHIEYRKEHYNPKDAEYNTYFFHAPRNEKEFSSDWYSCTAEQLAIVADEILYWDGNISNKKRCNSSYTSINKKNIDFIQFAFASIGIRASIHIDDRVGRFHSGGKYMYKSICYKLVICSTRNPSLRNPIKKKTIPAYRPKDGYKYCFTVPSGMLVLRRNGNINITGNSGKSSWLNSLLLNIVQQGYKIALWSSELRADILKTWIQMVAAGRSRLNESKFEQGRYYVPDIVGNKIDQWLDGKFFIYNNGYGTKAEQILNDMQILLNAGIKVFALDNLMSMDVDLFDGDKNAKQKELILRIKDFAMTNQVHIILVAHPRKVITFLRKNDISGTGDITNAVDNVFIIHRVNEDFLHAIKEFFGAQAMARYDTFGNVLAVEKNRMYGVADFMCGFVYESESRRFLNYGGENVVYDWDRQPQQTYIQPPTNSVQQQWGLPNDFEFEQQNVAPF